MPETIEDLVDAAPEIIVQVLAPYQNHPDRLKDDLVAKYAQGIPKPFGGTPDFGDISHHIDDLRNKVAQHISELEAVPSEAPKVLLGLKVIQRMLDDILG